MLHCLFDGERMHLVIGRSFHFTTQHFVTATDPFEFVRVALQGGDGRTDRTVVTDTTEICIYLSHVRDVTPRKVHPGHEYS